MDTDKNLELLYEAFEKYASSVMEEVFLEKILRDWLDEIEAYHRDSLITLTEFIGKSLNIITCIIPEIEIYHYKEELPIIGINTENEVEFYVFEKRICKDAFRIPDDRIHDTMSETQKGHFMKLFESTGESDKKKKRENDKLFGRKLRPS